MKIRAVQIVLANGLTVVGVVPGDIADHELEGAAGPAQVVISDVHAVHRATPLRNLLQRLAAAFALGVPAGRA